jgi:hypothetical protein
MKTARMFYSGLCATALLAGVALLAPPQSASAQTLVHRYSMDDDGTGTNLVDSAGGTNGYGWIMNPGGGEFSVSPGQLTLDASAGDYGQFPVGILSNYTSVTMDIWVSLTTSSYVWAFGNTDTNGDANNGDGGNALWLHGGASRLTLSDTTPSWASEQNAYFAPLNGIGMTHVTCVVDPPNSRMLVYTNGVLAGQRLASLWALSNVTNLYNYLGKSVYNADGLSSMTVDEFRIWNGAAGSLTVAGWDVTGPDVLGTAANIGTITNLMLSAPQLQTVQGGRETVSVTAYSTFFTNSDYLPI